MAFIKLENISKKYDEYLFKNLSLDVNEFDFIVVTGESGIGKTTLINILGLIDFDFEGNYYFQNQNISKISKDALITLRKKYISIIYQDFKLLKRYTIYQNLQLPLIVNHVPIDKREKLIRQALAKVNLKPNLLNKYPDQISGGQKQRVAIARALLKQPKLILADEPTGNLDHRNTINIYNLIKSLNITTIMVSHDPFIIYNSDLILNLG